MLPSLSYVSEVKLKCNSDVKLEHLNCLCMEITHHHTSKNTLKGFCLLAYNDRSIFDVLPDAL